jgi:hypothetical protein
MQRAVSPGIKQIIPVGFVCVIHYLRPPPKPLQPPPQATQFHVVQMVDIGFYSGGGPKQSVEGAEDFAE